MVKLIVGIIIGIIIGSVWGALVTLLVVSTSRLGRKYEQWKEETDDT